MPADYPLAEERLVPNSFMFLSNSHAAICLHKTGGDATLDAIYNTFMASGHSVHYGIDGAGVIWQFVPEAVGAGGNCCVEPGYDPFWDSYLQQYGNLSLWKQREAKVASQADSCYNRGVRNIVRWYSVDSTIPAMAHLSRRCTVTTLPPHAQDDNILITTSKGEPIILDEVDHDLASHLWYLFEGYAARTTGGRKNRQFVFMHRIVLERMIGRPLQKGEDTDHINGMRADNRRINLRLTTRTQNLQNLKKKSGTSSQYKGVMWDKERERWMAYITVNRHRIYLGRYATEEEAARAYNKAALEYFGEYARLNAIPRKEPSS